MPLRGQSTAQDPAAQKRDFLLRDQGRVIFAVDLAGPWLVKAVHMEAAPENARADWASWWASLTFQVPPL